MGRTQRGRRRHKNSPRALNLDLDTNIISLKRWMYSRGWNNTTNLSLRNFQQTGRGLMSCSPIKKGDAIIEVPLDLLITSNTLSDFNIDEMILPGAKLKFQDLLSLFLILNKHNRNSPWTAYIESLPVEIPQFPWLCNEEELECLCSDFKQEIMKRKNEFLKSSRRVRRFIKPSLICECCNQSVQSIITEDKLFAWAYIMVNTRAVYVNPDIFSNSIETLLIDKPCMALGPFLDMFNHSNKTNTKAEIVRNGEKLIFRLTTGDCWKKYHEIFISYGSHDNIKLLCEYGFFIPDYELDRCDILWNDIADRLPALDKKQYNTIVEKGFCSDLHVSISGISFNLKALLIIALSPKGSNWCMEIYNEKWSEKSEAVKVIKVVIEEQLLQYNNSLTKSHNNNELILNYISYKKDFLLYLLNNTDVLFYTVCFDSLCRVHKQTI